MVSVQARKEQAHYRLEAKVVIEDWRIHYNGIRPHSSLNYKTPNEFKSGLDNNLTTGAGFSM